MINNVTLTGRITRTLELKKTQKGLDAIIVPVAVDGIGKDKDGNKEILFIDCVLFARSEKDSRPANVAKYCTKGDLVGVTGKLHERTYQSKKYNCPVKVIEVYAESIEFLQGKQKEAEAPSPILEGEDGLPC